MKKLKVNIILMDLDGTITNVGRFLYLPHGRTNHRHIDSCGD